MAKERKPYTGGLVRPMTVPNVSFAQFQELATGASAMQRKLDTVVNFALKQEEAYQIKRGEEDAISNPITTNQYLDASPAEREALLGGERYTSYGKSVQATQLTLLSSEMAIKAQKDFNNLKIQAYTEGMNLDDYEANLNAIVNGYTDAIAPVNPQAAISIKSDLTTKANTFYSSYADKLLKDYKTLKDIEVINHGNDLIEMISDEFKKGHIITVINQDNVPQQISIDDHLNIIKEKYRLQLSAEGMSKEDFLKWDAAWDAKVLQEKKNILYGEFVDTPKNLRSATNAINTYKEVVSGNFNGNQKLQAIYNSLDEKEQAEFVKKVGTWKTARIKAFEDEDNALQVDLKKEIKTTKSKYYKAIREGDFTVADAIVAESENLDLELFNELSEDIRALEDSDYFLNEEIFESLLDNIYDYTASEKEINEAADKNEISLSQKRDLIEKLNSTRDKVFKNVDKYVRNELGYPEPNSFQPNIDKVAAQQYRTVANKLMEFYLDNPGISPQDIRNKADEFVSQLNKSAATQAEILKQKTAITNSNGKYKLETGEWDYYFKNFGEEGFTNVNDTYLSTPAGVDSLIRELEELKELEDGDMIKNKFDFGTGFRDDKFSRPEGITDDGIRNLIEDLKEYKRYL